MARKVFISVLGTGYYGKCSYAKGEFISSETRYIQHAILEYYNVKNWNENDIVYVMLTKEARENNWSVKDKIKFNRSIQAEEEYIGLCDEISNMNLSALVCDVDIKKGMTDNEMWDIFTTVYDLLEKDDELYLDLTHGYRYLPMLMLVLSSYAKFLKNIKVASVSYGNFEAIDRESNISPIVDLLPLTQLQDWTIAAAEFQRYGIANELINLTQQKVNPIIRETYGKDANATLIKVLATRLEKLINEVRWCRGINIYNADSYEKVISIMDSISGTIIKPLNPLINEIKKSIDGFSKVKCEKNLLVAAKWNFDKGNYQAAITELQEGIVTLLCKRNNIDFYDKDKRGIINSAIAKVANDISNSKGKGKSSDDFKDDEIDKLVNNEVLLSNVSFINIFMDLTLLRNDFNHSGMRDKSKDQVMEAKDIKKRVGKNFEKINYILESIDKDYSLTKKNNRIFINLSNHPSSKWGNFQIDEAAKYGDIKDMPFPIINPDADEYEIENVANGIISDIDEISEKENATVVVHIMGEMNLTFCIVNKLLNRNISCLASTTYRDIEEFEDGCKKVKFEFKRFREYGR